MQLYLLCTVSAVLLVAICSGQDLGSLLSGGGGLGNFGNLGNLGKLGDLSSLTDTFGNLANLGDLGKLAGNFGLPGASQGQGQAADCESKFGNNPRCDSGNLDSGIIIGGLMEKSGLPFDSFAGGGQTASVCEQRKQDGTWDSLLEAIQTGRIDNARLCRDAINKEKRQCERNLKTMCQLLYNDNVKLDVQSLLDPCLAKLVFNDAAQTKADATLEKACEQAANTASGRSDGSDLFATLLGGGRDAAGAAVFEKLLSGVGR